MANSGGARQIIGVVAILQCAIGVGAQAQLTTTGRAPESLMLGDLYGQVLQASPRGAAARSLAVAAQARVSGARRLPDPQLQLGFMNYAIPSLSPMPTVGMTQLQVMQMIPLAGKYAMGEEVKPFHAALAQATQDALTARYGARR